MDKILSPQNTQHWIDRINSKGEKSENDESRLWLLKRIKTHYEAIANLSTAIEVIKWD